MECVTSSKPLRALDYTASRTRNSHGERCKLLNIAGKKRSVVLLSISPIHKVVRCCEQLLEESNWMVDVSERAARLPKGLNILERILKERIVEVVAHWSCVPLYCNSLADTQLCHWAKVRTYFRCATFYGLTPACRNPKSVHNSQKRWKPSF